MTGALLAAQADGQISSGGDSRVRTLPLAEEVKKDMEGFRWHLGMVRLDPLLRIDSLGYNNNVFASTAGEPIGDWTASGSAGLKYIMPLGSKFYLRGEGSANYIWYLELTGLRDLGGTGSGHLVALFNRLRFDAGARVSRASTVVSQELFVTAPQRTTSFGGNLEIDVLDRVTVYAGGSRNEIRLLAPVDEGFPSSLQELDRNETAYRGGVRYAFRRYFYAGVEAEKFETRFIQGAPGRDYDTLSYLGTLRYDQPRFYLTVRAGLAEIKPIGEAQGGSVQTGTYQLFGSFFVNRFLELQGFGNRRPVPSLSGVSSYYIETLNGGGVGVKLGSRITLGASAGFGKNTYPVATGPYVLDENVQQLAANLTVKVFRTASLAVQVSKMTYDSQDPSRDRSISQFSTSLRF
ncbi:MAG: hypothetical protein L6R30_21415 [Thermoanaerobaculia bacterium]|nr:hypothetical protein [Thermoanaerobaculia bacterium]